ncbi:MAG: histidine kinase, partial [Halieaceae bacterium]|nr:histidine kinase [Halieaceae bacterium]
MTAGKSSGARQTRRNIGREGTAPEAGFFIPDLCDTRPVLMMFILAELLVVVYALGASSLPRFDWGALALTSLFVQWVVLLSAGLLCASRPLLARVTLPLGVALSFLLILLVALVSSVTAMTVFPQGSYPGATSGWWLARNLLVTAVFGGIALRYFFLQQQLRRQEQAELRARIESLRARIRPHFLFNTMNSIASLIGSRPDEAEQVVEDLSELFRASLVENRDQASLGEELHLCELYLRIEQLRLGDRLQVTWDVQEQARDCVLPPLLLQPLVENAVYHGVARMDTGGEIRVSAARVDGQLQVVIANPLPAEAAPHRGGHNMALDNIRQ